jgi:general secretion pathway protein F
VRSLLRERQLLPITVEEVAAQESRRQRKPGFTLRGGVSASELSLLTRQLSTLVRAGLPLEEALLAVSEQTERPRIQSILLGVRAKVMEGHTLATGLSDFPRVFPEIYRATVSAGEQSGHLDAVLERLAEYTESREVMRQKVLGAMLYPIVLTVMCFGIVSILLTYVVPKVVDVFEANHAKLPLATQILVGLSGGLRDYGLWLLAGIAALGVIAWRALQTTATRRRYHRALLRLPVFGRVLRGFNTARFTRTLSILTASAVPVLDSLRISSEVITNLPMRDAVTDAAARVREGAPIGRSLAQSRLFPPMTIHLISSGESSGELQAMLERAALNQERELEGLLSAMVGLLGPLLIVGMGLFVMGIVFAMLLPIFEMNSLIH